MDTPATADCHGQCLTAYIKKEKQQFEINALFTQSLIPLTLPRYQKYIHNEILFFVYLLFYH